MSRFLRPRPRLVFVFSTRGEQWQGMGRDLLDNDLAFRQTAEACDAEVQQRLGWSVLDMMQQDTDTPFWIAREERFGPVMVTLQMALLSSLAARGIRPDAVFGISVGEIGAAYAAGALSLNDTLAVSCSWSLLMRQQLGHGKRVLVRFKLDEAHALAQRLSGSLDVSCEFGPDTIVLAGETSSVEEAVRYLSEREVPAKVMWGDFAFHSAKIDSWKQPMLGYLSELIPHALQLPFYSSFTGSRISETRFDALYWWQVMRHPVYFHGAAQQVMREGYSVFLEIGPHPVFGPMFKKIAAAADRSITYLPAMLREADGQNVLDRTQQRLAQMGYRVE